jgi:hypothetical protein
MRQFRTYVAATFLKSFISLSRRTQPPEASLGKAYAFRQADGGGNNLLNLDIGRAGTPYSRSVLGKKAIPATSLPDPGLVFDTLMRARDVRVRFPSIYSEF